MTCEQAEYRKLEILVKADQHFYRYCEYTKYWTAADEWENRGDPIISGIRLAIGQYIQKGALGKGIQFSEFVQCLNTGFAGGALNAAREAEELPKYSRQKAKKHKIGQGYATPNTGECGYE
ncbi:hypothetical protein ACIWO4_05610 [Avibacterium paragallinarum]|uniref:hypothetical protein n=1 Tax=Avibacterium paragallinarum TaxID=728 RepID=UPI000614C15E|nr:hypothetical protein [Avibacterium paragallinarum]KAA6207912.1 hypothetical protein F1968_12185 [Avibacterium paragallinarum]KKB00576.1 hypothetical protein Z012_11320 [Avibacterium paragallinarum]RZN53540.1 hypothetical protein EIG78_12405 [Avibacterium paragallinarum]RZN71721.1 hypothetical protein EIG77_06850 [Avibacterium paragallinarum]